jgi:hypothetical protein
MSLAPILVDRPRLDDSLKVDLFPSMNEGDSLVAINALIAEH